MSIILDMVKNIAVYLILVTIVMNLLGQSSYKKYVSIFTGMLLILIVVSPILKLFQMGERMDFFFDKNLVSIETEELTEQLIGVEHSQKEKILNGYKEKIKKQIEAVLLSHQLYVVSSSVTLEEEENSKNYGGVKSIELTASYTIEEKKEDRLEIKEIEEVNIDKIAIIDSNISESSYDRIESLDKKKSQKTQESSKKSVLNSGEIEIAKVLAEFYGVPLETVQVNILEN